MTNEILTNEILTNEVETNEVLTAEGLITEARDKALNKIQEIENAREKLISALKEEVGSTDNVDELEKIFRYYMRELDEYYREKSLAEERVERFNHEYDIASRYPKRPYSLLDKDIPINVVYYEAANPKTFKGIVCDFLYVFCGYEEDGKPIELYVEANPYDYGYYDDYYDDPIPATEYDEDTEIDDLEKMLYALAEEHGVDSSEFVFEWDM